jgi:hypothetical protein
MRVREGLNSFNYFSKTKQSTAGQSGVKREGKSEIPARLAAKLKLSTNWTSIAASRCF